MPSAPGILRIGNAQAFWGDSSDAPARLVAQTPHLDVLTLDYLAEVSMSILARQHEKDAALGYARDFIDVIHSLAPVYKAGRRLCIVSNGGGLNPGACAAACIGALRAVACKGVKIAVVDGDDVLSILHDAQKHPGRGDDFRHMETGAALDTIPGPLVTANAYLGAAPLVEALRAGADIVITGRVADPSLTVAPCMAHFGWAADDYDRIAAATIAGHLIECGTQVTGGISTDWLDIPDAAHIGYPIVEVSADGSCIVTKPAGTGGRVNEQTVKEQLLYEIGDPGAYLSPDATVSFLTLAVKDEGGDRVSVRGATGRAPSGKYKVSATYRAGFRAAGTLTVVGRDAVAKARRCGQIVLERLRQAGDLPSRTLVECIGAGDVLRGVPEQRVDERELREIVLRIAVADERREIVERFTRELAPLVSAGPQGITGYAEGRPAVREIIGYWPTLIDRDLVKPRMEMIET